MCTQNKYRWKCRPTHTDFKQPFVHLLTHTQTAKRGWWETPVAVLLHWCQHWANRGQLLTRQIYECYSSSVRVCVCMYSCWDSPWLNRASYTSTSSELHCSLALSLSVEGLMSSLTSLHPPWLSHGTEGEEEEWRKPSLSAIIHSSSPWECEKNPEMLAVTNRAIKLYGPAEHATLLMLWEVMQKWHHPPRDLHTRWLTTMIYTKSVWPKLQLATIKCF